MRVICGSQFFSKYFPSMSNGNSRSESSRTVLDVYSPSSGMTSDVEEPRPPPAPGGKLSVDFPAMPVAIVTPKGEPVAVDDMCCEVPETVTYHAEHSPDHLDLGNPTPGRSLVHIDPLGIPVPVVKTEDEQASVDIYPEVPENKPVTVPKQPPDHLDPSNESKRLPPSNVENLPVDSPEMPTPIVEPKDEQVCINIISSVTENMAGTATFQAQKYSDHLDSRNVSPCSNRTSGRKAPKEGPVDSLVIPDLIVEPKDKLVSDGIICSDVPEVMPLTETKESSGRIDPSPLVRISEIPPVVEIEYEPLTVDINCCELPQTNSEPIMDGSATTVAVETSNIAITFSVVPAVLQHGVDGLRVATTDASELHPTFVGVSESPKEHQPSKKYKEERTNLSDRDSNNNRNAGNGEKNSVEDIPLPTASGCGGKDTEADGPSQVLAWVADASKEFTPKLGTPDIKELENMISLYLAKVSSCIPKCYVPNRAAKMKRCMNDVLMFFNFLYQEIAEDKKAYSTYLDKMTELMAYYIDMEIQASSRAKENPLVIASKLTSSLFIFLDKSHDHILDSILKANNVNKNFWELCSLIFSGVLKDTSNKIMSELTYVRYILAYKMWKRVVQGPDERKRVMSLASVRLKHPPQFVDKIRAGLLNGIIPKVPKKRCDVTTFLIQAKFDVKEKAKAFLKYVSESKTNVMFVPAVPAIKTDIPLLVGYLPDFGPSLSLVKLDRPNVDEDNDPKKVDISGSRLMNEVWTSINHEASFREAIRMQNVTTFNRIETKVSENNKIHSVLKHKKAVKAPAGNKSLHEASIDSMDKRRADSPDVTIVLSDDSEKGSETVEIVRKSRPKRVSKSPPAVLLKQERMSPTRTEQKQDMPSPDKEGSNEVIRTPVAKRPIINPSQIKRETEIDDVIIMESPEPLAAPEQVAVADEEINDKEERSDTVELELSLSLKKAEICQPNSPNKVPLFDRFTKDSVLSDKPCDLKEEKVLEVPTKEKEINIRINRDLFEKIKYQDDCDKTVTTDDAPPKSMEISLTDSVNKLCGGADSGKDDLMAASPDRKSDTALFDDEENSWSPSGGSQEFFRNVVDTFISRYLPVDDVDTQLSGSNVPSDPLATNEVVGSKGTTSCELFHEPIDKAPEDQYVSLGSNEKPPDQNDPVPEAVDATSPPAKRCRINNDPPSVLEAHEEESVTVSKSADSAPHQLEEQPNQPKEGEVEAFADPDFNSAHDNTCKWDHIVFLLQTKLRDVLPTDITTPIPSPDEMDPDTGRPVERCSCSQCAGNYKALMFNHNALVGFQNDFLKVSQEPVSEEGGSGASASAVASASDQLEPKQEDDNLEQEEDGSGSATDSVPQLPFKKRKALVSSNKVRKDDGGSQHSDTSKDGMSVDYPATPMLSIALLESCAESYTSPPLPDSSTGRSYSNLPPLVTAVDPSYTSSLSGVLGFSSTPTMSGGYCNPGPSAVGGFPYIASTETLNPASLPGGSSYNSAPHRTDHNMLSTGFGADYTSTFPSGSFPSNSSHELMTGYSGLSTSRPLGGGFPPFSAVIPPLTNFPDNVSRLEQHPVDATPSRYDASSVDRSARRGVTTRRFATPAQLKQAFTAKDARSCKEDTSYCDPVSYSRKHTSSACETRSSRSKKEPSSSSRKSGRSTRKKK